MNVLKKIVFSVGLLTLTTFMVAGSSGPKDVGPQFKGNEKMAIELKNVWLQAMATGNLGEWVSCMVKFEGQVDSSQIDKLKVAGMKVRTRLNTIVTGKIRVENLPYVTEIEGVQAVEGGKKMSFK